MPHKTIGKTYADIILSASQIKNAYWCTFSRRTLSTVFIYHAIISSQIKIANKKGYRLSIMYTYATLNLGKHPYIALLLSIANKNSYILSTSLSTEFSLVSSTRNRLNKSIYFNQSIRYRNLKYYLTFFNVKRI